MMADKENSGVNPNVLIFSPPKTKSGGLGNANLVKKKGDVLPTLIAARFNGGIRIDFGHVDLGSFHSQQFRIDNPSTSKAIKISIHKEPANKGFDVMLGPKGQKEITISEKSCVTGVVTWSAEHNASLYEKVTLKMDEKLPLDITITGKAGTGKVRIRYACPLLGRDTHRTILTHFPSILYDYPTLSFIFIIGGR